MSREPFAADFLAGRAPRSTEKCWVHVPVVSVDLRGPLRFRPLSDDWWGVYLHHDGRSYLCTGRDTCRMCRQQCAARWAGYLPVVSRDLKTQWVVKVTEGAAIQLQKLREAKNGLVGLPITFRRAGPRRNSPVRVELDNEPPGPLVLLPAPFDVRPIVLYVHGYSAAEVAELLGSGEGQQSDGN